VSPYRVAVKSELISVTSTSRFRLLMWRIRGGHRRLQAARLRRAGFPLEALKIVCGTSLSSQIIIDLLRANLGEVERQQTYVRIARYWSAETHLHSRGFETKAQRHHPVDNTLIGAIAGSVLGGLEGALICGSLGFILGCVVARR